MRRILCLIENLGSGGAERQLTGLAVMLKQRGFHVEVCYYIKNEFYLSYLQDNGVDSCFLEGATHPKKRFFVFRNHINSYNPDTIVSFSASTSMIACLLKLMGAKFNLIVSERNTTQQIDRSVRLRFFLYKWANYIVPNSYSQAEFINSYFANLSNKVKVISNYVDTDVFSPSSDTVSYYGGIKMICVGRLMPQKNIPRFIEAIGRVVRDGYTLRVDWFGQDLCDAYSDDCHNAILNQRLEGLFVFHKPSARIVDEYLRADVFCLPSQYEGFPNVLCEAMSCGLPVLCGRVSDNPNIVREGENGLLFDPLNIDNMVSTIEQYLDFPGEKKYEMGKRSRSISLDLFSKEKYIDSYLSIIV